MTSDKPTVKNDKLFWTTIIPTVCDDLKILVSEYVNRSIFDCNLSIHYMLFH